MLLGLVFCSLRNLVGSIASLLCCMDITEDMLPELIMCLILWVAFTVLTLFFFLMYKCPLKIACRSNVRIEVGALWVFVPSDQSGEKGQENGFPSCLEAGGVWGCHQVKLSALERTGEGRCLSKGPKCPAPQKEAFRQGKAPELFSFPSLFLFVRVASWRKSSARVLHQRRKILTSLASWLIS